MTHVLAVPKIFISIKFLKISNGRFLKPWHFFLIFFFSVPWSHNCGLPLFSSPFRLLTRHLVSLCRFDPRPMACCHKQLRHWHSSKTQTASVSPHRWARCDHHELAQHSSAHFHHSYQHRETTSTYSLYSTHIHMHTADYLLSQEEKFCKFYGLQQMCNVFLPKFSLGTCFHFRKCKSTQFTTPKSIGLNINTMKLLVVKILSCTSVNGIDSPAHCHCRNCAV